MDRVYKYLVFTQSDLTGIAISSARQGFVIDRATSPRSTTRR